MNTRVDEVGQSPTWRVFGGFLEKICLSVGIEKAEVEV
jgi:hypothetical protein